MINYFSQYVFSYQLGYYGSYLDAFIFHCILLEQVELYSKQLTYLDEKRRNFFHNFIYNLYIIYNIKFCLLIQIPLGSQTFLILSARSLRGERVLFHYFQQFGAEYEYRYGREYGYFLPIAKEVVEKCLDCSNPTNGFGWIWCSDCGTERFLP